MRPNNKPYDSASAAKAGFTLIEILLVVVIIGVLAGIAGPLLTNKTQKAQISAAKAEIESIGTALRLYELDNGTFPSSLSALVDQPGGAPNWDGPYVEKEGGGLPKDPWGQSYTYSYSGGKTYTLSSQGPPGGEPISND